MNARERYVGTLLFEEVDRYPLIPGGPRESTLARWHREGLPEGRHYMDAVYRTLGIEPESTMERTCPGVDLRMRPQFEEKVLRHEDGHYVVQDWMGNVVEISDKYDYTYLRRARDFVTRRWISFPVEDHADWERMKARYDAADPLRFPTDFEQRCARIARRDYPVGLSISGPFWQLREWVGFEPLCMLTLTDPDFVAEMTAFWTGFVDRMLNRLLAECPIDYLLINEDMAYKGHSMISPQMTRRFIQPAYHRWVATVQAHGCPLVIVDSDGYIDDLIPIWIESGIQACTPVEVAAHNDIVAYRKKYGRNMAFLGGVDKRLIAAGGEAIRQEVARVCSLLDMGGGLIPGCDHGVPPDISWPHFLDYARLLAQATGWLHALVVPRLGAH